MDIAGLSSRLTQLSISPAPGGPASVQTYFFTPKSGSTHPVSSEPLKLVAVSIENDRNVGPAKTLAQRVDLKDMRALSGADLSKLLGRPRTLASILAIPAELSPSTLVVSSATLTADVTLPSPINDPSATEDSFATITLTAAQYAAALAQLGSEGAAVKELEFGLKGEEPVAAPKKEAPKAAKKEEATGASYEGQAGVQLGLTVKKEQAVFGEWFQQVLVKSDMLDYYDVSGCYILKPWSYYIWGEIQAWFDSHIKQLGVDNSYFPMFVSSKVLEREKDHIEGFAPEVAWVTRAGKSELEEPIAIRPTSETVMYPYYAKWIRSHRDLPLKLNQWNSVVRWEFKNPQPFLRTREFLWQEGHTAFLTQQEADKEVLQILDLYRRVYEELLAVPVIPGVKSEKEKFAGGKYTTTVEGFIPTTGRGIQGATSHSLGQNFSKMFNIAVEDPSKQTDKLFVWQNSWGLSTRSIGVMVMVHGDDKGLVLPPRVAKVQVIVIPVGITAKTSNDVREKVFSEADRISQLLVSAGVKAQADLREGYTPGFKYNDWELKGVPIRLEVGPKDLEKASALSVRRDSGAKAAIPIAELATTIPALLDTIHGDMLAKARALFDAHIVPVYEWKDVVPTLNKNCVIALPWCEVEECEDKIKERSAKESVEGVEDDRAPSSGAKSLCIPHDQARFPALKTSDTCPNCGRAATKWTLFGRSY